MALTLSEVIELKNLINEKGGVEIHMHDACGGQYFTLGEPSPETVGIIKSYLEPKGIKARYSPNNDSFTIGGLGRG